MESWVFERILAESADIVPEQASMSLIARIICDAYYEYFCFAYIDAMTSINLVLHDFDISCFVCVKI